MMWLARFSHTPITAIENAETWEAIEWYNHAVDLHNKENEQAQ